MSDIDPEELEAYAERTGIPLTAPAASPPAEIVAVVGEAITLDLGNGAAAWDDSELVNAWDAAAEEFRLHNPGPGTWLDKVTAAQAIGQPLPGATHGTSNLIRTRWYTETPPAKPTFVNPYTQGEGTNYTAPPAKRKKSTVITNLKKKRKREEQAKAQGTVDEGEVDMELDSEHVNSPRPRRISPYPQPQSPAYTPASPPLFTRPTAGPALPERISRTRPSNPYAPSSPAAPETTHEPTTTGLYPSMGATGGGQALTREEATTRAVNAQWWAGYWFAMSEVMPSRAELEQTQSQMQR